MMKVDLSENNSSTYSFDSSSSSFIDEEESSSSNDSCTTTSRTTTTNKSVSFSPKVSMQIHSLVVGDSPECPLLPLQLDWNYDIEILDLDQYESSITTRRRRMRGPKKLLFYERSELLQDVAGYSLKEIQEKKKEAQQRMKQQQEEKDAITQ